MRTLALILLSLAFPNPGQPGGAGVRYRSIELAAVAVDPGSEFPSDYLPAVETALVERLRRVDGCERVAREGSHASLPAPVLKLVVLIGGYQSGTRVSDNSTAKLTINLTMIDRESNRTIAKVNLEERGNLLVTLVPPRARRTLDIESATARIAKACAKSVASCFSGSR